jgi:nucleotide-binding universal stress UspA family protein
MLPSMSAGTIVVGVDGSEASKEALRWAAAEARLRGARLRVVHAWTVPLSIAAPEPSVLGHPMLPGPSVEEVRAALAERAERVLDDAVAGLEGVEVEPELVEGTPAHALVRAAEGADLVVVGSRGLGGFKGLLLGSVSQQCTHHAPCPVVIVPPARRG